MGIFIYGKWLNKKNSRRSLPERFYWEAHCVLTEFLLFQFFWFTEPKCATDNFVWKSFAASQSWRSVPFRNGVGCFQGRHLRFLHFSQEAILWLFHIVCKCQNRPRLKRPLRVLQTKSSARSLSTWRFIHSPIIPSFTHSLSHVDPSITRSLIHSVTRHCTINFSSSTRSLTHLKY